MIYQEMTMRNRHLQSARKGYIKHEHIIDMNTYWDTVGIAVKQEGNNIMTLKYVKEWLEESLQSDWSFTV